MSSGWIAAFVALWVIVLVLGLALLGVLRRIGNVLERAEAGLSGALRPPGLEPGSPVPAFEGIDDDGATFGPVDLYGRRSLLVFLSADCPPCRLLADELRKVGADHLGAEAIVVVDDSPPGREFAAGLPLRVVYQQARGISAAFQSTATPHAFAIDERGVVVDADAPNTLAVLALLAGQLQKGGDTADSTAPAVPA